MDSIEYSRRVLAGIIPDRRDLLDSAQLYLEDSHFIDPTLRGLYKLIGWYAESFGGILPCHALTESLEGKVDAGKILLLEETYNVLAAYVISDGEWKRAVEMLRELQAKVATEKALTEGMQVLRTGNSSDPDILRDNSELARTKVLEMFADIDRDLSKRDSPEGDMRLETEEMLQDYADRQRLLQVGARRGILFGIPELDGTVGGLQPGELDLIVAATSEGKTSLVVQLAWAAVVEQGRNVVFLTTETNRQQVRRKILARHSTLPVFELPDGLNSRDIKDAVLSQTELDAFERVTLDFGKNPSYGHCYIVQVPRGATIATCEARLYTIQRKFNIDLVIIDYLRLLQSSKRRSSDREELSAIIIEAKQVATTFDGGRGVPIVSPWQTNRASKDAALRTNDYAISALAESAEASNTSDVVISLLAPDQRERHAIVKCQVLKNRDGETSSNIQLNVDYATSTFTAQSHSTSLDELLEGPTDGNAFAGLL